MWRREPLRYTGVGTSALSLGSKLRTYGELKTDEESSLWDELPPIYSGASAPRGA